MKDLSILINFCTNEFAFLGPCLQAARAVSDNVIVSVCDHFFDGKEEDRALLNQAYLEHPSCQFLEYAFEPSRNFYGNHPTSFWHNWGRLLGFSHVSPRSDAILFLDVDEILDSSFSDWFKTAEHADAERLSSYWYFRETRYRAKHREDGVLLARKDKLTKEALMHPFERVGTFFALEGTKKRHVSGKEGNPMIHHYSWVRTKQEMLCKVRTWGHRSDAPWQQLVEQEFSHPFSGKDFIYGDTFQEVEPHITLTREKKNLSGTPQNVRFISTDEMHRIELLC